MRAKTHRFALAMERLGPELHDVLEVGMKTEYMLHSADNETKHKAT